MKRHRIRLLRYGSKKIWQPYIYTVTEGRVRVSVKIPGRLIRRNKKMVREALKEYFPLVANPFAMLINGGMHELPSRSGIIDLERLRRVLIGLAKINFAPKNTLDNLFWNEDRMFA